MNLFFRLLLVYFKAMRRAGSTHYNDEHKLSFRVLLTDQDVFNHMNNSRYLSMTDLAMIDWLVRTGSWKEVRQQGWFPVFVYKELFFIRQLQFPARFTIETRLAGWQGSYVCLEHRFVSKGTCCAISRSIGRVIGKKGQRPNVDDLIELLSFDPTARPELPIEFKDRLKQFEDFKSK